MAKSNGLGWTALDIDDVASAAQDLRNDVNSLQFACPIAVGEITGIDLYAIERQALLGDFSITLNGAAMNPSANKSHAVLASPTDRRTPRTTSITVNGKTLATTVLYTDYQLNRGTDGGLPFTVPGVLSDGVMPAWS